MKDFFLLTLSAGVWKLKPPASCFSLTMRGGGMKSGGIEIEKENIL